MRLPKHLRYGLAVRATSSIKFGYRLFNKPISSVNFREFCNFIFSETLKI